MVGYVPTKFGLCVLYTDPSLSSHEDRPSKANGFAAHKF